MSAASSLGIAITELMPVVDRLTEQSRDKYLNPYENVDWPASVNSAEDLFFTPELTSLHGTTHEPPGAAMREFAFHEAANFFSLNIHGEKSLMAGLATRMYRSDLLEVTDYLQHFLDEENKHSVYFGGFCRRYAKLYRSRHVAFAETPDRAIADFLFFAKALIFEEHSDRYNVLQAKDERLHPLARFINQAHHADESRHLTFNRVIVKALWEAHVPQWSAETLADLRFRLEQFFLTTWREYYNPDVYADAGFDDPWQVADDAWAAPSQVAHRRSVSAKSLRFFRSNEILEREPVDVF